MFEWPVLPLEELAAPGKSSITKPYGSAIMRSDYRDRGVPVVRGVNLADGVFHDDDFVFIDEDVARRMPGAELLAGDLVITHRGTIGQVAMIPRRPRFRRYATSTSHVKVRLDASRAVPEFYRYWFSSNSGKKSILENVSTVGVPGLAQPVATVKRLLVPHPPIREQRAIAEVLGSLDDKIAANRELVSIADALAEAHFLKAVEGTLVRLVDIAQITMGSSPPGTSYNEDGRGTVFYQGVRDFGPRTPTNRVWTDSPVRLAERGDVLVSVRAPVGRSNFASEPTCIGRGLAAVQSTTGMPKTLFHRLRATPEMWAPFEAEGTVFGSINQAQLSELEVCAVSSAMGSELESNLLALEDRIDSAFAESRALKLTRDELLPLMMSGRVRVKDAEKVVEGIV